MRISKKEGNRSGAISLVVAVLGLVGAVLGFVGILTAQYLANVNNERLARLEVTNQENAHQRDVRHQAYVKFIAAYEKYESDLSKLDCGCDEPTEKEWGQLDKDYIAAANDEDVGDHFDVAAGLFDKFIRTVRGEVQVRSL